MRCLSTSPCGRSRLVVLVLAAALGFSVSCLAQPAPEEVPAAVQALRLSGFGTLGVSRASAPDGWGLQRNFLQPPNGGGTRFDTDSRLGLQANYSLNPRVDLVGQLLLTRRLSSAPLADALTRAFVAYRPTESLTLRVGRVAADEFLLSEYRSVGVAYPFVRPPTEIYAILPDGFDGLDLTKSWRDPSDGVWKLNGVYGNTKQGDNRTGRLGAVRPAYGGMLSREEQGLLIRASFARARLASDTPELRPLIEALQPLTNLPVPSVAAEAAVLQRQLTLRGQDVDYLGLGLNLDRDDWLWMLEAYRARVKGAKQIEAGYMLLGHRFGALSPYAVWSAVRTRPDTARPDWTAALAPVLGPAGAAQAQALADLAYASAVIGATQRTWSLGLRWDVAARAAVKLQYDRSSISARGSLLWAHGGDEAARAHVLSATLDFVF